MTAQNARQVDDILRKVREAQTKIAEKYEESLKAATAAKTGSNDMAVDGAAAPAAAAAAAAPPSSSSGRSRSRSPSRRSRQYVSEDVPGRGSGLPLLTILGEWL